MQRQILRIKIHVREGPPSPACHAAGQRLWARLLGSAIPSEALGDERCTDRSYRPRSQTRGGSTNQRRATGAVDKEYLHDNNSTHHCTSSELG
jgi:hypothetical protein